MSDEDGLTEAERNRLDEQVAKVLRYAKVKYDEGGYIKPGLTTVTNTRTESEPVLGQDQCEESDDE